MEKRFDGVVDSDLTKDLYLKLEAVIKSNISKDIKLEIVNDLINHASPLATVWAVEFYDGDAQNGGTCYFWTYEDANDEIGNMKEQLNGWTSSISEPEVVSFEDADMDDLLREIEER